MTPENKRGLWTLAAIAAIALILRSLQRPAEVVEAPVDVSQNPFYSPWYQSTPGITDLPIILNGATAPFESTVNVYVDNPAISQLSQQYIPMFGFVGMTAVS